MTLSFRVIYIGIFKFFVLNSYKNSIYNHILVYLTQGCYASARRARSENFGAQWRYIYVIFFQILFHKFTLSHEKAWKKNFRMEKWKFPFLLSK